MDDYYEHWEEALEEIEKRDARIKELEELVEKLKCCWNCKFGPRGSECGRKCLHDLSSYKDKWEAEQ